MKKINTTTVFGIVCLAFALFWIYFSIESFISSPSTLLEVGHLFFFIFAVLIGMSGSAFLLAYFAIRLIRHKTRLNIKVTMALLLVKIAFLFTIQLSIILDGTYEDYRFFAIELVHFLLILLFLPAYVILSRRLLIIENMVPERGEFIGKVLILYLSFKVFLVAGATITTFAPLNSDRIDVHNFLSLRLVMPIVKGFGPIGLAVACYFVAMYCINLHKREVSPLQ